MPVYHAHDLSKLATRISQKSEIAKKASALAINKSATYAIKLSIDEIIKEAALQPNYVKKHLRTVARASPSNLRAIISANARATLLTRYPHVKTPDGIRVKVNATGGYREIKGARVLRGLKGSSATGIALRNKDAVAYFSNAINKGKRTPEKSRKLQRIIRKARTKPYGMTVLHSRSINQLFTSKRVDIQPELKEYMVEEFIKDFRRLGK